MTGKTPLFRSGSRVRVLERKVAGHCRVPFYVRGHEGVIERACGAFGNPESLGHGGDGLPKQHLYRVRFSRQELWLDAEEGSVDVEIYEHWLQETSP